MYSVVTGEQTQEFETRAKAIEAAKEISDAEHGKVTVYDESGCESLTYRNGALELYLYETRNRRRRG
ncbi:MAG: hypothetical protein ACQEXJ_04845 [Myxococcota bacterium]